MKLIILGLITTLILFGCNSTQNNISSDNQTSTSKNTYLDDQTYCEQDSDCIDKMQNCALMGDILNCRNKYYTTEDQLGCYEIDMGITPDDKCLCNEELNKCEIVRS